MVFSGRSSFSTNAENPTYSCTFCSFRSGNGIEVVKHLFQAHTVEDNFCYVCVISSCTHAFTTGASFDTFCGHCARKHHDWKNGFIPTVNVEAVGSTDIPYSSLGLFDSGEVEVGTVSCSTASDQDMDEADFNLSQTVNNTNKCEPEHAGPEDVKMAAAKFLLTLKEEFKLTQTSLDYTIKAVVETMLLSANVHWQHFVEHRELASIPFDQHSSFANPFVGLRTEYQQKKCFNENFGLIVHNNTKLSLALFLLCHYD